MLTDNEFFQGSFNYLKDIKAVSSIPLLDKDFIFDPYQIYLARYYGADAILLIMSCLTLSQAKEFEEIAMSIGLDVLVETLK